MSGDALVREVAGALCGDSDDPCGSHLAQAEYRVLPIISRERRAAVERIEAQP